MSKTIHIDLMDSSSIDRAIHELRDYQQWLERKAGELAERLATLGAVQVSLEYARAVYTGDKDVDVTVEKRGENTYAIVASGATVLILEFGAGVTYGYGHPQAGEFGYGPTTYPGQTHAADPKGWWIPGGEHTYGNPPSMTMYRTAKELEQEVERIAKEVFRS